MHAMDYREAVKSNEIDLYMLMQRELQDKPSEKSKMWNIYIYIYVYVCVCVCVCINATFCVKKTFHLQIPLEVF